MRQETVNADDVLKGTIAEMDAVKSDVFRFHCMETLYVSSQCICKANVF